MLGEGEDLGYLPLAATNVVTTIFPKAEMAMRAGRALWALLLW